MNLLVDTGVPNQGLPEGARHDGIGLRFNGESHRTDFKDLVGEQVWLYPQASVQGPRRTAAGGAA